MIGSEQKLANLYFAAPYLKYLFSVGVLQTFDNKRVNGDRAKHLGTQYHVVPNAGCCQKCGSSHPTTNIAFVVKDQSTYHRNKCLCYEQTGAVKHLYNKSCKKFVN